LLRALANDLWENCASDCLFSAKDASKAWGWQQEQVAGAGGCWSAKMHSCLFTDVHKLVIDKWKKICSDEGASLYGSLRSLLDNSIIHSACNRWLISTTDVTSPLSSQLCHERCHNNKHRTCRSITSNRYRINNYGHIISPPPSPQLPPHLLLLTILALYFCCNHCTL